MRFGVSGCRSVDLVEIQKPHGAMVRQAATSAGTISNESRDVLSSRLLRPRTAPIFSWSLGMPFMSLESPLSR